MSDFLLGRLGLDTVNVAHASRHGLVWLEHGNISIEAGCVSFRSAGTGGLPTGTYSLPQQDVSAILMGPGTTISHDALRILASQGVAVVAVGSGGVRMYTAPPLLPDSSKVARHHARLWVDDIARDLVARKMFGIRFGEVFPSKPLDVLRGMEGARVRRMYETAAQRAGIRWTRRDYDRTDPGASDDPNAAVNHAVTCAYAAASIAVAAVGAIPQLGFIHEASGDAFCLDIADLYRMEFTIPTAFEALKAFQKDPAVRLEAHVRRRMARRMREEAIIDGMIARVKDLLDVDDHLRYA